MTPLDSKTLVRFYSEMLRIRVIEEKIAECYSEQEMRCPVHLCIGQEAVAVGVCANLTPRDYAMGGHRAHGHYLGKGGNLSAMIAELYGKVTGCCEGKGGSMHLVDLSVGFLGAVPIVGSTIAMAVGAAFGSVMKNESRVTVPFFGDGATEEGVFHESVNFAALKKLPVVFVCENNFFSVYSPLEVRQPDTREIFSVAKGHGIPSVQGDGNDVVEVYELAREAIQRAREGKGPSFLEFKTYRWREHCGPAYDNHLGYRSEQEFAEWKERCPIRRLEERLLAEKALSTQEIEKIHKGIEDEILSAFEFAKASPFPGEDRVMDHLYSQ